jgi:tRNA dimethylallyltransferase
MKRKLVIIAGPTASGKTAVSIEMAKRINGEIISADSMQIYKYMDIGSAKVTEVEKQGITHYLVDELEPSERFSVTKFQSMAKDAMEKIYSKGKIPIIVGGTGFYIQSIVKDIDFSITDEEEKARASVEKFYLDEGKEALHLWLMSIDERAGQKIHANNLKRVKRAIEYYLLTGEKISDHNDSEKDKESPYDVSYFVLTMERELLYHRINKRVDAMMDTGLVQEVEKLKEMGYKKEMTAMQGLGYKEIFDYLDSASTLSEAEYIIKRDTRHFAKRQLTWFRREKKIKWLHVDHFGFDINKICDEIIKNMN